jgi:hypothetical protein
LKITIEIVDFPIENGGSFHSYVTVYQRVNLHFPMVFLWFAPKFKTHSGVQGTVGSSHQVGLVISRLSHVSAADHLVIPWIKPQGLEILGINVRKTIGKP